MEKRGKKDIELNVDIRLIYIFAIMLLVFGGAVAVNALPSDDGHSVDEIEGICYSDKTGCGFMDDYYTKTEFDNLYG